MDQLEISLLRVEKEVCMSILFILLFTLLFSFMYILIISLDLE